MKPENNLLKRFVDLGGWRGFVMNIALGGFAVLGHAPFYIWPVTLVCLALFMIRLDGVQGCTHPVKAGFWAGFGVGFGYFLFGLYWIGSAFLARGSGYTVIMPFAILAFCAALALFWAVAGAVYVKLVGRSVSAWRAGVFASVLFLTEFVRGHVLGGFPWNIPGYIFAAGHPVSQIASLVGIYGVSVLVLFLSAGLALGLGQRKFVPFALGLVVLASAFGYGSLRLKAAPIENTQYVDGVKLRIVHAKISQKDKFDSDKYVQIVDHYFRLSMGEGFDDITHIIWPEGAVPGLMFEDPGLMQVLEELMRSGGGEPPVFITQTLRSQPRDGHAGVLGKFDYYNAAAAISFPREAPAQISRFYDKRKLVPFGEFVPGGRLVEKLGIKSLSTALASITPGKSKYVPILPGLPPVSIQICYEIIFPGFTPQTVSDAGQAPEWILNVSNDSWYGDSAGPYQHINQARYRAIEQGLPVVRSTSGGISGVIDSYGRQLAYKNLDEDGVLDTALPRPLAKTVYSRATNFIIFLLIAWALIGCYVGVRRSRQLHLAYR
ncbi:MAG: apolipoprotein N-acyltransferase [Robiginitomaculum sp.]|nr:MAG: apolipoprotein N-acyltransferase [Robiginitomaculum sp.]